MLMMIGSIIIPSRFNHTLRFLSLSLILSLTLLFTLSHPRFFFLAFFLHHQFKLCILRNSVTCLFCLSSFSSLSSSFFEIRKKKRREKKERKKKKECWSRTNSKNSDFTHYDIIFPCDWINRNQIAPLHHPVNIVSFSSPLSFSLSPSFSITLSLPFLLLSSSLSLPLSQKFSPC